MNNVHPLFRDALSSVRRNFIEIVGASDADMQRLESIGVIAPAPAPVKVSPTLRPYVVSIYIGQNRPEELNVVAFTSCDAITKAIDIYFDGEDPLPSEGMEIVVHPRNLLPSAA